MLTLKVECSNHQTSREPKIIEITLDTIDSHTARQVKYGLELKGWVVQFNGDNMDTYCTKTCAK